MSYRNRTDLFYNFRNSYNSGASHGNGDGRSSSLNLMEQDKGYIAIPGTLLASKSAQMDEAEFWSPWMANVAKIDLYIKEIRKSIEQLKETLVMERWPKIDFGLSPKSGGSKGAVSSAFEGETAKIKDMFSNAQKQVNRIGLVRSRMAKRPQADRLICNAQESMKSKLCLAGELFSALQQAYLEQLEKNKEFVAKRVSKAPTVIVPPTQQSNQKVPAADEYIEMPLSPNGQSQMLLSRQTPTYSILDERQEEITRIWSNCMEVFEILRYMQALIEKQGDQLDRIDTNMDEAMVWMERAKGHIEVVRKDQDVALKRNMIVLSLVSAIFIMLLIIIFR